MIWTRYYRFSIPLPPSYFNPSEIRHTKEYQITIKQTDWVIRDHSIQIWVNKMNELLPELNLTEHNRETRIYAQTGYGVHGSDHCRASHKMHVRGRNFTNGKFAGSTSLDFKQSGYDWESCPLPLWPSESAMGHSVQKCEHDIHPCFSKHSRVTKLYFSNYTQFHTCGDLVHFLPDAFYKIDESYHNNPIKQKSRTWVHLTEYSGILGGDTDFSVSFDIRYKTRDLAKYGKEKPSHGEFSIRLSCVKDRDTFYGSEWNEEVLDAVDQLYFNLVLAFDKFPEHIECANEFFRTGIHA